MKVTTIIVKFPNSAPGDPRLRHLLSLIRHFGGTAKVETDNNKP